VCRIVRGLLVILSCEQKGTSGRPCLFVQFHHEERRNMRLVVIAESRTRSNIYVVRIYIKTTYLRVFYSACEEQVALVG
jgi:hypothetical protein